MKISGTFEQWCPGAGSLFLAQSNPLAPLVGQNDPAEFRIFSESVSHRRVEG